MGRISRLRSVMGVTPSTRPVNIGSVQVRLKTHTISKMSELNVFFMIFLVSTINTPNYHYYICASVGRMGYLGRVLYPEYLWQRILVPDTDLWTWRNPGGGSILSRTRERNNGMRWSPVQWYGYNDAIRFNTK